MSVEKEFTMAISGLGSRYSKAAQFPLYRRFRHIGFGTGETPLMWMRPLNWARGR
jgi:hypothetical protein